MSIVIVIDDNGEVVSFRTMLMKNTLQFFQDNVNEILERTEKLFNERNKENK
jgi:hypothetical protein